MDWFNDLGAYAMFLGTPALAVDMATNGPKGDFGFYLSAMMQRTSEPLTAYPAPPMLFGGEA